MKLLTTILIVMAISLSLVDAKKPKDSKPDVCEHSCDNIGYEVSCLPSCLCLEHITNVMVVLLGRSHQPVRARQLLPRDNHMCQGSL